MSLFIRPSQRQQVSVGKAVDGNRVQNSKWYSHGGGRWPTYGGYEWYRYAAHWWTTYAGYHWYSLARLLTHTIGISCDILCRNAVFDGVGSHGLRFIVTGIPSIATHQQAFNLA